MQQQKNIRRRRKDHNKSFKIIIILLTFLLLGSLFYIYKLSDRTKHIVLSLREEKSMLLKDLEKSELLLGQTLNNKTVLYSQLVLEQEKVKKLIADVKKNDVSEAEILKFKKGADNINDRIKVLLRVLNDYKKKIDSTTVVLAQQKELNDTLSTANNSLSKKITDASKLYYYNLQTKAYKLRNSGEIVETEKARKVDLLKISFSIAENKLVNAENKLLYVQIIDSKNNVIGGGKKNTEVFGNNTLIYSYSAKVKYKSKTIKIEDELAVENLEKGLYFINVFDRSTMVLQTNVTLL
jgi:hypothetical protein